MSKTPTKEGPAYLTLGIEREDGDFQVLATLNNADNLMDRNVFESIARNLTDTLAAATDEKTFALRRQDVPDYIECEGEVFSESMRDNSITLEKAALNVLAWADKHLTFDEASKDYIDGTKIEFNELWAAIGLQKAAPDLLEAGDALLKAVGHVTGIETERRKFIAAMNRAEGKAPDAPKAAGMKL